MNTGPVAILGEKGRVQALTLSDGRELPAAAVLLAVGVAPNLEFLAGAGLTDAFGLTVNAAMQTGHPDIFAAGDCTRAPHFLSGEPAYYPIWPVAVAGGRVAGANMAGAGLAFDGLLPQNSISLRGFHMITGGLGPGEADDCEVVSESDKTRGHYRRWCTGRGGWWASPSWAQNSISLRGFHLITGGLGPGEGEDCEVVSEFDKPRGHYRRLVYREGRLVGLTFVGAVADAGIHFQLMARQEPVRGLG